MRQPQIEIALIPLFPSSGRNKIKFSLGEIVKVDTIRILQNILVLVLFDFYLRMEIMRKCNFYLRLSHVFNASYMMDTPASES
jgi:hypothetical protein